MTEKSVNPQANNDEGRHLDIHIVGCKNLVVESRENTSRLEGQSNMMDRKKKTWINTRSR